MDTSLQQVITVLQEKGYSEEQVSSMVVEVTKQGYAQIYAQLEAVLTDEDAQEIEKCETQEQANETIKRLYKLRIGQDAEEFMKQHINNFATGFLKEQAASEKTES